MPRSSYAETQKGRRDSEKPGWVKFVLLVFGLPAIILWLNLTGNMPEWLRWLHEHSGD